MHGYIDFSHDDPTRSALLVSRCDDSQRLSKIWRKMWCFEHEGFVPDMITTAKGFGGGIYPISATVMNRKAASGVAVLAGSDS